MYLISGIIDHYCIMENFKKLGKNKNKLRAIYPKNHENFKNSKPRVQFYWFLYKKRLYHVLQYFMNHSVFETFIRYQLI